MFQIAFSRPATFNADAQSGLNWIDFIGDTSKRSIDSFAASEVVLTLTAASGLPGHKLVLKPTTTFTREAEDPDWIWGRISTVQLIDDQGRVVATANLGGTELLDMHLAIRNGYLLTGSSGDDVLTGGSGSDAIDGGDGNDIIRGGDGIGGDLLIGGRGRDRIEGNGGNDSIRAGAGDTVLGGDGNDVIVVDGSMPGSLVVDGGADGDLLDLTELTRPVSVYLNRSAASGGILVKNVEVVVLGVRAARSTAPRLRTV